VVILLVDLRVKVYLKILALIKYLIIASLSNLTYLCLRWSLLISPLYPLPTTIIVIGIIVSFRYGAFQALQEGSLNTTVDEILRTFVALVFSTVSVGVLTEMQGELYQAGKLSAKKIFTILDRMPTLDNLSSNGIKKVYFFHLLKYVYKS